MGMFDSVSSTLDTVSQTLAGGTGAPAAADAGDQDMDFWHGQNLDVDKSATESAGQAPNLENALNGFNVIEFIHFGYIHTSHSNFFTHDDYSDLTKNDAVQDGDRPRAIQFRSALEREAILLSVFMECTQTVLQERADSSNLGGLGSALNTLGGMLGESIGGSGRTSPADLNAYIQKVVDAVKPVLPDTIEYKNTHQAGIDFNQARANYRKRLQTILDEKPTAADPTSSFIGQLPGVGGVAGPFANVVTFTQGVAFKPQEIKAKFHVLTAQQQEPQIEAACNEMTLSAIANLSNPFLPVWFGEKGKTPTWDNAPANPLANNANSGNLSDLVMNPLVSETDKLRQSVIDQGNAVKGFFEHPPDDPPPGTDALGLAFLNPPVKTDKPGFVPMKMADVASKAFITALGMKPPLGVPQTVVDGIVAVALEFTETVYKSLLVRDETKPIDQDAMVASARGEINVAKRLEDLALDKLKFLSDAKSWQTPDVLGFQTKPGDLLDKGTAKLDELVQSKISPILDPIVEYAMKNLAVQLELGRQNGVSSTSHTMEWYLGRLPWVQSTLFCNLFLPFWNALMRVAADVIGGPVGSALKAVVSAADKAKSVADTGRNLLAKVDPITQAAQDTASDFSSLDQNSDLGNMTRQASDRFDRAGKTKAAAINGPKLDQGKFVIPVTGRSEKGQAKDLDKPAYDEVSPNHKWDSAKDRPATTAGDDSGSSSSANSTAAGSGDASSAGSSGGGGSDGSAATGSSTP